MILGGQTLHHATETSAVLLSVLQLSVYSYFMIKIHNFLDFWRSLFVLSVSLFFEQPLELTRKILRDKQNKKNSGHPIPVFPSWVYERPALIGDFLIGTSLSTDPTVPIGMSYTRKIALPFRVLYLFRSAVAISWHSGWKQNWAPCTLQLKTTVQKKSTCTWIVHSVSPVLNSSPAIDSWALTCFEFPRPFSVLSHSLHKILL